MASEGIGEAVGWPQVFSEGHPEGPHDLHLSSLDVPGGGEDGDWKKSRTTSQRRVGKQFLKTAEVEAACRQPLEVGALSRSCVPAPSSVYCDLGLGASFLEPQFPPCKNQYVEHCFVAEIQSTDMEQSI